MKYQECNKFIFADLSRLCNSNRQIRGYWWLIIKYLCTNASFKITFWYRIGSWLLEKKCIWKVLFSVVSMIHKHHMYKTGIQLPLGTIAGGGLKFEHFSCVVINPKAIIGENCTIFQGVTIGSVRGTRGGIPIIGDNVVICSGAQVIGPINIGNNVIIGAGAVCVSDIPNNAVAVGCPAKVSSFNGLELIKDYN